MSDFSLPSHSKKRISFIVATKNRAKFLDKALKRHEKLKTKDDELIVVDGNSSDKTRGVIKKHSVSIDTFICEDDVSEGHAFNKGILTSRGKYMKLLTDDDEFYPEAIEKAYKIMEENPQVDVLLCGGTKINGKRKSNAYVPDGENYGKDVMDVFKWGGCGLGLLIRRGAFAKTGLFTPSAICLDTDFIMKSIFSGANVKFCRINMFNHPVYPHSGIIAKKHLIEKESYELLKKYASRKTYLEYRFKKIGEKLFWSLYQKIEKSHTVYRLIAPVRLAYKKLFIETPKASKYSRKKIIWDGGFS